MGTPPFFRFIKIRGYSISSLLLVFCYYCFVISVRKQVTLLFHRLEGR